MTTYPRHGSASTGAYFIDDATSPPILELSACAGSAQFSHNLACNSPAPLSNVETRTLIFRGFQDMIQNTLRGIACEMWGSLSQSGCFFPVRSPESATSGRPQTPASYLPTTVSPIVHACTIMEA
ncbi:hypothetical protein HMPREF1980_02161 [Actinomyces sp. oral taxon 172 str. F0311]|nr:hypothetical protein HMPREF1980_02161 [Actinomyces sp. oral taxon 172 str. F0311]